MLAFPLGFWFSVLANGDFPRWTRQNLALPALCYPYRVKVSENFFESFEKTLDKLPRPCHKGLAGDTGEPRRTNNSNLVSDKLPFIAQPKPEQVCYLYPNIVPYSQGKRHTVRLENGLTCRTQVMERRI